MRKNFLRAAAFLLCVVLALSGCGNGAADNEKEIARGQSALAAEEYEQADKAFAAALEREPAAAEAARGLVAAREGLFAAAGGDAAALASLAEAYGALYAAGDFGPEEYLRLAEQYALSGDIPAQRDALERAVRLAPSQETADLLFGLVVDAARDSEAVAAAANELLACFQADDMDAAVALTLSEAWRETMMPVLTAGTRKYTLAGEGEAFLKIEVGYADGVFAARAWYTLPDGAAVVLRAGSDEVCCARVTLAGGVYTGPFHLEYCDGATGSKGRGAGVFTGGLCTGDYSEAVAPGAGAGDAGALWAARGEGARDEYAGAFTETGAAAAPRQGAVSGQGGVVYAYDASGLAYLCVYPEGGNEGYVFTCASMGVPPYPAW